MKKIWNPTIQMFLQPKNLTFISLIAIAYVVFSLYLIDFKVANSILQNNSSLNLKAMTIFELLWGLFVFISNIDRTLLVIIGILVGFNLRLFLTMGKRLQGSKVKLSFGGGSILGLFSAGCTSCGFSLFSLMGIGTTFSFLPFGNRFFYLFSIGALATSIIYMIKRLEKSSICKLNPRQSKLSLPQTARN